MAKKRTADLTTAVTYVADAGSVELGVQRLRLTFADQPENDLRLLANEAAGMVLAQAPPELQASLGRACTYRRLVDARLQAKADREYALALTYDKEIARMLMEAVT